MISILISISFAKASNMDSNRVGNIVTVRYMSVLYTQIANYQRFFCVRIFLGCLQESTAL